MLSLKNRRVIYKELYDMAWNVYGNLDAIYLHWTAGLYGQVYDDYHFCINEKGEVEMPCRRRGLAETLAHTWRRNSRSLGIAIEAAKGAVLRKDGSVFFGLEAPPTEKQIRALIEVVALIAKGSGLNISRQTVMTHAEAAALDGYGPFDKDPDMRWDLWQLPGIHGISGGEYIRSEALKLRRLLGI